MASLGSIFGSFAEYARSLVGKGRKPPSEPPTQAAIAVGSQDVETVTMGWLYRKEWMVVTSEHHRAALYDGDHDEMVFQFKDGKICTVEQISFREAKSYLAVASKGTWYWDVIRVRGKGNAKKTKKPFHYGMRGK